MTNTPARPFPLRLPELLPQGTRYAGLLGVPMPVVEELRRLRHSATAGDLTLPAWREQHTRTLGGRLAVDPPLLDDLCESVGVAVSEAVDADLPGADDLAALAADLKLLAGPDPEAELEQIEDALLCNHPDQVRQKLFSQRDVLLRMLTTQGLAPWADGRSDTTHPPARPGFRTR